MGKFDVKDKIDSYLYRSFNVISDGLFLANFNARRILKRNSEFKLSREGSRCFIVGTGPSLKDLPEDFLRLISKEVSFGVNFLYKSSFFEVIKPDYYVLMDDLFWGDYSNVFSDVSSMYGGAGPIFVTDYRAKDIINNDAIYLHAKHYPVDSVRLDICGNSSALMNVVSYSIATAIFLGFKEIYLVGCDYNAFCTSGVGHCYDDHELKESGLNLAYFLKFYHITTQFHYLLSAEAKKRGVKIVNLTDGSLLDAYQRSSYKDLEW